MINDPKTKGGKIERSFQGKIGYQEDRKSYYFVYTVPYKKSNQGQWLNETMFSKQQFGDAHHHAGCLIIDEMDRFVRHFAKDLKIPL